MADPRPTEPKKKRGHPRGPNQVLPVVIRSLTSCPKCGSTERTEYSNTRSLPSCGVRDGKPYNLVVWRYCRCLGCGQARVDKTFEQR